MTPAEASSPGTPAAPLRVLVSVRDVGEALAAQAAGVDFIDLKDPDAGALGALPAARRRAVLQALAGAVPAGQARPMVTATVGDWPMDALDAVEAAVRELARDDIERIKVGIAPDASGLRMLAGLRRRLDGLAVPIVPVVLADDGLPLPWFEAALALPGPAEGAAREWMIDTAAKGEGSLLQRAGMLRLSQWLALAHRHGARLGLAGSLTLVELPLLRRLAPDWAGFRGAVCAGDRRGALDPDRLAALLDAARRQPASSPRPPSSQASLA